MIFRNKIKSKVIAFVDNIALLSQSSVNDEEKKYLEDQVKEARLMIRYHEWYIGFEILMENLYEIGYKLEDIHIESAKEIFLMDDPSQSEETLWWLNDLRKE